MVNFLKYDANNICGSNNNNIAKALASQENWNTYETSCTVGNDLTANNRSLFTAQPAGRYENGFGGLDEYCNFMTSTVRDGSSDYVYVRFMSQASTTFDQSDRYQNYGSSVRCVKDAE